jgi:broad specificity phosphatase PhoE
VTDRTTRLWLVRHGQSTWNAEGRIQGQSGEGLSAMGRRQARAVAAWLADTLGHALVVSSDLPRARETAEPVATALGADLSVDRALRERSFGRWEGRLVADLEEESSDLWRQWARGVDVVARAGGESGEQMSARVTPALRGHARRGREAGRDVVVVSHGGVIWHGLHDLLDLPPLTLGGVGNASVSTLLFASERTWLDAYNGQAHLPARDRTTFQPREFGGRDVEDSADVAG